MKKLVHSAGQRSPAPSLLIRLRWFVDFTLYGCASLLLLAVMSVEACAASQPLPDLLVKLGSTDTPPSGWRHEHRVDGGIKGPGLAVNYSAGLGAGGRRTLEVDITNASDHLGFYTLFIGNDGRSRAAVPGASYRLTAAVQSHEGNVPVVVGFHLWGAQETYLTEAASTVKLIDGAAATTLSHNYVAGNLVLSKGASLTVPSALTPRIGVYGIPARSHLRLRIHAVSLIETPPPSAIKVMPLAYPTPEVAAGNVLKLTVPLELRPMNERLVPAISLVDVAGRTVRRFVKRIPDDGPGLALGPTIWGPASDPWQFRIPLDVPQGRYSLRYGLVGVDADGREGRSHFLVAGDGVTAYGGNAYEIGHLTVKPSAGLSVGQHFHRIPGSSENGPVMVPHHFVRSLNNDRVGAVQWWTGEQTLCEAKTPGLCSNKANQDWRAFDVWIDYHAKARETKVLLTFFGSPRWASARPTESNGYCVGCGLTAEPAPQYMPAYRQMIIDTVARYRDRLMGVECWNEPYFDDAGKPRPSSYFTGSPTALADVCKAIYLATKSIDTSILVFCPQAPSPEGMANVLSAQTSQAEPIHRFCDVIGAHAYNAVGADTLGRDYGSFRIADAVRVMRATARRMKLDKPLAITEWGIDKDFALIAPRSGGFAAMASRDRGEMIYQTLATLQELGVSWIGLYSYDSDLQGLWQGLDPVTRRPRYDATQAQRLAAAVRDIGRPLP